MRIPKPVLVGFLLVVVLLACVYFLFINKGSSNPANSTENAGTAGSEQATSLVPDQKSETAPIPVKAVPARRGDLVIKLKSPGEAFTDRKIALKAEVGGVVKNLYAAEGRHVKKNEILIELEDREYRLNLEKADAERLKRLSDLFLDRKFSTTAMPSSPAQLEKLRQSELEFKRASEAFSQGLITSEALDKAQNDYELALIEAGLKRDAIMASSKGLTQAEVEVKIARMQLEKTKVRAPFAGIITDIKISPREHLDAGRELFTLVNISQIRVKAKVLESEIGKMRVGQSVDLRLSAYPGKVFKGVVEAVAPVVNVENRTCAVHIIVQNPTEEIKPGMHAEVEIAAETYKNRLLVPQEAILVRGGRKLVFVVVNGLAKWRYITVGLENEGFAEILPSDRPEDSLSEGDMIITEGHFTLAHDARVTIKN